MAGRKALSLKEKLVKKGRARSVPVNLGGEVVELRKISLGDVLERGELAAELPAHESNLRALAMALHNPTTGERIFDDSEEDLDMLRDMDIGYLQPLLDALSKFGGGSKSVAEAKKNSKRIH